ncbi:MAG TPA: histidine kinase [Candidatus Binataceae bacterium]|nr:histidine kinase [Candidatus Binataceae bacterium]
MFQISCPAAAPANEAKNGSQIFRGSAGNDFRYRITIGHETEPYGRNIAAAVHGMRAPAGNSGNGGQDMNCDFSELDRQVARARVALSLLAMLSLYVDPSAGGLFHLQALLLATLVCHLAYSALAYVALRLRPDSWGLRRLSATLDLFFASAVAFLTEGGTSPSFVFFVFAIVAAGFRTNSRDILLVTLYSVFLYALVVAFSGGLLNVYMMRAVYLAIAGYLIGFFGRQRVRFEARLRELEAETERLKIARSLHDGYIQALASINLRLESCRDMLLSDQPGEALAEIKEIQTGVDREYDEVRDYVRFLANATKDSRRDPLVDGDTIFRINATFAARGKTVEHVIQILLEGVRNVQRHARARSSVIEIDATGNVIRVRIDDDGVGFGDAKTPPWTIASRVTELGGRLALRTDFPLGAHLDMEIPAA